MPQVIIRSISGLEFRFLAACLLLAASLRPSFADQILFTEPQPLHSSLNLDTATDLEPHVACDGSGICVTAWLSAETTTPLNEVDANVLVSRSTDQGKTWSSPQIIYSHTEHGPPIEVRIAADSNGDWIAAWSAIDSLPDRLNDIDLHFSRSTDGGATWSPSAYIEPDGAALFGQSRITALEADDDGNIIVLFDRFPFVSNPAPRVHFSKFANGASTWTTRSLLALGYSFSGEADLHYAGANTWFAAANTGTESSSSDNYNLNNSAVTRSLDGAATWENYQKISSSLHFYQQMQLASDAQGNWVIVARYPVLFFGHTAVIRSTDQGQTWSDPVFLTPPKQSPFGDAQNQNPALVSDGNRAFVSVWSNTLYLGLTPVSDTDLHYSYSTDGGASWSVASHLAASALSDGGHDREPRLAYDGAGGFVLVWHSTNLPDGTGGSDPDIWVSRGLFINNTRSWTSY
jgi:hypothetical protein